MCSSRIISVTTYEFIIPLWLHCWIDQSNFGRLMFQSLSGIFHWDWKIDLKIISFDSWLIAVTVLALGYLHFIGSMEQSLTSDGASLWWWVYEKLNVWKWLVLPRRFLFQQKATFDGDYKITCQCAFGF